MVLKVWYITLYGASQYGTACYGKICVMVWNSIVCLVWYIIYMEWHRRKSMGCHGIPVTYGTFWYDIVWHLLRLVFFNLGPQYERLWGQIFAED